MNHTYISLVFAVLVIMSAKAEARVIPEVKDFVVEQTGLVSQAIIENETDLTPVGRKFSFEAIFLRLRGVVGFDAANSVNLQLLPELELVFEREPEKVP